MNSVATATIELPRRIMTGSLSGDDLTALVISCFFEAMLVGAVLMAHKGSAGRRLLMAARRAKGLKDSDLTAVLAAGRDLPPDLAYVASEIERYRIAVWPFQFVIVVHGCADPGLRRIAEVMPSFCALDIAMRHPFIPEIVISRLGQSARARRDIGPAGIMGADPEQVIASAAAATPVAQRYARCREV